MKVNEKQLKEISKFIQSESGLKLDSLQTLDLLKETGLYDEAAKCFDTFVQDELIDALSHKITGIKWHCKKEVDKETFKKDFKIKALNFGYLVI